MTQYQEIVSTQQVLKQFELLKKIPHNIVLHYYQYCFDCQKKNPNWVSINLGIYTSLAIFLCIDCAGKHRQYGVNYSFIRSPKLDSWKRKQLLFMEKGGNKRAYQYFKKCGLISDNCRNVDYKSHVTQRYIQMIAKEVENQISGISNETIQQPQKQIEKVELEEKKLTSASNTSQQIIEGKVNFGKKPKKMQIKKVNNFDFDNYLFDDGIKDSQIKAKQLQQANIQFNQQIQIEKVVQKQPEQLIKEAEQTLEKLKAKNLKAMSSDDFNTNQQQQSNKSKYEKQLSEIPRKTINLIQ